MNKFRNIIATVALTIVGASAAHGEVTADNVKFIGDTEFSGFCNAVIKDDLRLLRSAASRNVGLIGSSRREVLRAVSSGEGVTCNGVTLLEFSESRDATRVYNFLKNKR